MLDQPRENRLLIISNEPLVRTGLSSLLEDEPNIALVGQVEPGSDLENTVSVFNPDLILWDLGWETSSGEGNAAQNELEQIAELSSEGYSLMVLISSPDSARDAWIAGAKAILLRDVNLNSLRAAIMATVNELVVLDASISVHLLPELGLPEHMPTDDLTPRELQVLQQLAEGYPNKIIATQLGVSEHTVKFHINSIFRKLAVRSRTEAVVRGSQLGLILF
jgi:DNA-binding NarL/FixJ family response regulator